MPRGGRCAVRSHLGTIDPRPPHPDRGEEVSIPAHPASHRIRWLVDGRARARAGCLIPSVFSRPGRSAAAAGNSVPGLCGLATAVAGGRTIAAAGRLLAAGACGCARGARIADGPAAATGQVSRRRVVADRDRCRPCARYQAAQPIASHDGIHDGAGGVGGGVVKTFRPDRPCDWYADGQPQQA